MQRDHPLLAHDEGCARVLTLNRPDRLNALNADLLERLEEQAAAAAGDPAVRVVIVAAMGDRAFSAGADLDELAGASPADAKLALQRGQAVFRRLEQLGKPVIASVNGHALGGGFELALACTFIAASTSATFGLPEAKLGLMPGYGGTQRLPRLIGRPAALRMMLSGESIRAQEAFRLGVLTQPPVAPDELSTSVFDLARRLSAASPTAQRLILEACSEPALDAALAHESVLAAFATTTEDAREGIDAFRAKRSPRFAGAAS
jgi:enoyl-CoA hydratase